MLKWALRVFAVLVIAPLVLIPVYRFAPPPLTTLMLWRAVEGNGIARRWVPLEDMSRALPAAVISAEDARFCEHNGVDWEAVEEVLGEVFEEDSGRPRGASTITMQTVKNLFLWPARSYLRKAIEVPLAYYMDFVWPKRRILEIYLNVVEWAPGVYGAEAAARHHFRRSAARLSSYQASLMAAALPDPHGRRAGRPGPLTRRLASVIRVRMRAIGPRLACLRE